ncbi:hypothetical protein FBU59_002151 [Linderina macrospora]|uniref:Uncharacterized protein n=1 Tax=Linderina macrospora TaxID=4868 RepID=A0ACC1JC65_9FUNG|nr:hypothetical protein FBU59_002151 [Linderina macrospora]
MVFSFLKQQPEPTPVNPAELLAEAQEYIAKEDFEGALAKFDELCSLPVQSPLPLLSRATCRLQMKKYEGVIEDCEEVLKYLNTDVAGHDAEGCTTVHSLALFRMAKAYKELGQTDNAKSALMRKNAIEHKLGRDRISDEVDGGDSGNEVESEQKIALEWKEKGNVEYKNENWTKALECYKHGIGYDMYNSKLHSNACMTLIKLRRWGQALKHAEQCIALEPKWVKGYYMKGVVLSSESRLEQSRDVLKQALVLEPGNSKVKELLEEVTDRIEYVETRLRRRKNAKKASGKNEDGSQKAEEKKKAVDAEPVEEDVDSDEDYCNDDGCKTPKKVQLRISRKDIIDTCVELGAAALGVALVWILVNRSE